MGRMEAWKNGRVEEQTDRRSVGPSSILPFFQPSNLPICGCAAAAFTLVELMLAVTLLAVVIIAVYSTWSVAFTAWKRGTEVTDNLQRQRVVMDALTDLAKSAVFATAKPELYEVQSKHDETTGDLISFVTAAGVALPPSEALMAGLRRVTIALQRDQAAALPGDRQHAGGRRGVRLRSCLSGTCCRRM